MQSRTLEIWVGFFVFIAAAALIMLALKVSNLGAALNNDDAYTVIAKFENVGGLKIKAPVKMSGVRIGRVSDIQFDDKTFKAIVKLQINNQYRHIPNDSSASIYTSGILGEQYVGLDAGAENEFLTNNSELFITQSAIVLEQLISKFLYNSAANSADKTEKKN